MVVLGQAVKFSSQQRIFANSIISSVRIENPEYKAALINAFANVERDNFLAVSFQDVSRIDMSLPIGNGQTISKPSTVAQMLALLNISQGERVLEVGAGCGYVVALLCALDAKVFAIERLSSLANLTRKRLDRLGLSRVPLRCSDGKRGWRDMGPFDVILVSAALDSVPEALLEQLSLRGRLLAPVLNKNAQVYQGCDQHFELWKSSKLERTSREFTCENVGPCHFVSAV